MKNQHRLRRFLTNAYAFRFFDQLIFFYPLFTIFFVENGVPDSNVSLLLIIWALSVMAAQIPVAAFASILRPKTLVIFGQLMKISCFALWFLWPTFGGFAIGFMLWGIQWAIDATVFETLLYDELRALKKKSIYAKICGRQAFVGAIAAMIATSGSLMLFLGYGFVVAITAICIAMSVLFILRMENSSPSAARSAGLRIGKTMKLSMKILKQSPHLAMLLTLLCLLGAINAFDDYIGLIGTDLGVPVEFVGGLFLMNVFCKNTGKLIAHKFEKVKDWIFFAGMFTLAGLFAGASAIYTMPALPLIGCMFFVQGILIVLAMSRFQHGISSSCRIMMLSIISIFSNVFTIGMYMLVGGGILLGGYSWSLGLLGAVCVIAGIWAAMFMGKQKRVKCEVEC